MSSATEESPENRRRWNTTRVAVAANRAAGVVATLAGFDYVPVIASSTIRKSMGKERRTARILLIFLTRGAAGLLSQRCISVRMRPGRCVA